MLPRLNLIIHLGDTLALKLQGRVFERCKLNYCPHEEAGTVILKLLLRDKSGKRHFSQKKKPTQVGFFLAMYGHLDWLRGQDLNLRPLGYEPNELPGCSTARYVYILPYSAFAVSTVLSSATSGRSTNSTKAIGALSPTRNPIFKMRVYPPGRAL